MRALVVCESIFGNTRHVAEAIAADLRVSIPTDAIQARQARAAHLCGVDLLVVGAPTHAWGLSGQRSRQGPAVDAAKHPDHLLDCDPVGPGVREWQWGEEMGRSITRGVVTTATSQRVA